MPMIVYVTRSGAFLGSHLCDRSLSDGYVVVAFDNFVTGSDPTRRRPARIALDYFRELHAGAMTS